MVKNIIDIIGLEIQCEGLTASEFGKYDILGSSKNENFEITFKKAIYHLSAPYKVFYKLRLQFFPVRLYSRLILLF